MQNTKSILIFIYKNDGMLQLPETQTRQDEAKPSQEGIPCL